MLVRAASGGPVMVRSQKIQNAGATQRSRFSVNIFKSSRLRSEFLPRGDKHPDMNLGGALRESTVSSRYSLYIKYSKVDPVDTCARCAVCEKKSKLKHVCRTSQQMR